MSGLTQYSGNVYYVKISFTDGTLVMPIDQTSYSREVSVRISAPNASGAWDPSNDYSYQGLSSGQVKTANIPVYDGTAIIFGSEPNGTGPTPIPTQGPTSAPGTPDPTSAPTTVPTTAPTAAPTAVPTSAPTANPATLGDVNTSGTVDIVDALLVAQYYVGLPVSNFNTAAADVNCSGGIDIVDALLIAQYYVGLIAGFC